MDDFEREELSFTGDADGVHRSALLGTECRDFTKEFTLPDYVPDIKKVVSVKVDPEIEKLGDEDGVIPWECRINYSAMLLCEDDVVRSVPLRGSCSGEVRVAPDASGTWLEFELENRSMRATDPRKLTARCRVCVRAYGQLPVTSGFEIENGSRIAEPDFERRCERVKAGGMRKLTFCDLRVSEDLELPPDMPQVRDVVECDVDTRALECRASEGGVDISGEAFVSFVYTGDDGGLFDFKSRLPVSAALECDAAGGETAWACARTGEVNVAVQPTSDGEERIIELDFSWCADVFLSTDGECEITVDLFSPDVEVTAKRGALRFDSPARLFDGTVRVARDVSLEDASLARAVDVRVCRAMAYVTETAAHDGLLTVGGEVRFDLICSTADEGERLIAGKAVVPFTMEHGCDAASGEVDVRARAFAVSPSARITGSELSLAAEVCVTGMIRRTFEVDAVKRVEIADASEEDGGGLTVYYTAPGDAVWDVAKRYRVPVADILDANSMRPDDLPRKRVLLIPGRARRPVFSRVI